MRARIAVGAVRSFIACAVILLMQLYLPFGKFYFPFGKVMANII